MPKPKIERELESTLQRLRSQIENDFARIEKNGGRISQAKRDELRGMLDRYDQIEACRKQARSDRVRDEQKVYLWQPNSHDALSAWSKHCEHLTKQLNC